MYNIALCDDKGAELDKVETMLKNYQEEHEEYEFQVERFTSAEEMLRRVRGDEYMPDLLLTDIYMDKKSGIEAAEELRDMGSDCRRARAPRRPKGDGVSGEGTCECACKLAYMCETQV